MHVQVAIYQAKAQGGHVSWTTVGLGALTRARSGAVPAKVQEALVADLKKAVEDLSGVALVALAQHRRRRLVRCRLELSLRGGGKRRRFSGLYPLIVERRFAGTTSAAAVAAGEPAGDRWLEVAYHPLRQDDWFPLRDDEPIEITAQAALSHALREAPDGQVEALATNGKDLLKSIAFSVSPRSLLEDLRAEEKGIWDDLRVDPTGKKPKKRKGGLQVLPSLGTNLTQELASVDPADLGMPRAAHRDELAGLLTGRSRQSVIIVGEPGTGKTTLVRQWVRAALDAEGYANHQNLDRVSHVWSLSGKRLIAGMSFVGDWEQRCIDVLEDLVRGRKIVLYVPDLHRFGQIGRARNSDRCLADFFRGPVARGEISLVGECTAEQLQRLEDDAPAFARLFTRLPLHPTSPGETLRVLLHESRTLEAAHPVVFQPTALRAILEIGAPLVVGQALPGKAVDLMRRMATRADTTATEAEPLDVDPACVVDQVSEVTGLPRALVAPECTVSGDELTERIGSEVLGQPEAVSVVVDVVLRIKAGLVDPRRPYGVLLFTGPTGTGKTELARSLARYLYGGDHRLLRFDMSELGGPDAAARLVGDAAEPEGLLTRAVRMQPLSVVLLDEIDKAHRSVQNLLLQLLEDGRLTDAAGDVASFRGAVIVMTSNLGAHPRPAVGFVEAPDAVLRDVARAVREFFPAELFNRIDRVVPFRPLSREVAVGVAAKELAKVLARPGLERRNVFVRTQRAIVERVAEEAFRQEDGARSLKRFLEDRVATELAEGIARAPSAILRLVDLRDDPASRSGFTIVDQPLLEARPLDGVVFAIERWLSASPEALTSALSDLVPRLDRLATGPVRVTIDASRAAASADDRYWAEELARQVDELRDRCASLTGARRTLGSKRDATEFEDEEDRYEEFETGKGRDHVRMRMRVRAPDMSTPRLAPGREDLLGAIARAVELERFARSMSIASDSRVSHAVVIELRRVAGPPAARWTEDPHGVAKQASLVAWLVDAYLGRGALEAAAVESGGSVRTTRDPKALRGFVGPACEAVALSLSGLAASDFFEHEAGCHLWQPLGTSPEVVRVHVTRGHASDAALRELLAPASVRGPLPPMVRRVRFDPPARQGVAVPIEIEDYRMSFATEIQTQGLPDALARLWLVRSSLRHLGAPRAELEGAS